MRDEAGIFMNSNMSLKSCSTRKRKKIQSEDDEKVKNKKRRQQKKNKKKKEAMVKLFDSLRFGRFLTPKKKNKNNKKTQSYFFDECVKRENRARQLKGKIFNLSDLLFTQHRDFLITYYDRNRPVQAKHLEGKVIVLHFVALKCQAAKDLKYRTTILLDMYHVLQPKGGFEVVFIGVPVDAAAASDPDTLLVHQSTLQKYYEDLFSFMPWTAIPFSDIRSMEYWESIFSMFGLTDYGSISYVIDPTGMVLQCHVDNLFSYYGARAYPFTDARFKCIASEDTESWNRTCITKLLASPERDFLINKDNQVVPLHYLEDKVVGLYFDEGFRDSITSSIQEAYEQLAKEKNFEIVFVYIHDAKFIFKHRSEKSYWQEFREMPWLALPFKDPICKKLQHVFNYPTNTESGEPDPRLVIVGPQGKFVEQYAADILLHYGISAYPFTRKRVAELEAKKMKKELKLKKFWPSNISLIRKDGSTVQLSQLVGKRIILVFENVQYCTKFWRILRARYLQMKDTNDEFEVIHICGKERYSYGNNIAPMSWLRLPAFCARDNKIWLRDFLYAKDVGVFAFDRDGTFVRRTLYPSSIKWKKMSFPFYSGGLKEEVRLLENWYQWAPWSFRS